MKDNPVYRLSKRRMNEYRKTLSLYGKRTQQLLNKHKATPNNQAFLRKWLFKIADDISKETQRLLVDSVDDIIIKTLETYNKLHKGDRLSDERLEELFLEIRKEFLLSKFKDATVDQRISQAERRLKANLQMELQNLVLGYYTGSHGIENLINSITGTDYKTGGTAYRWNSRLVLSEMYRAYQFTSKVVLAELGVKWVEWVNSPRHEPNDSVIDEYAEKVYKPNELPDYPYPCNDSYFIPIY
jgi:hypothetical protein